MGAETILIQRFNPPAISSMAYLPCCEEWADCREMEECPFCGLDLSEVWGAPDPSGPGHDPTDLRLVKAIYEFDRLGVEGDWTMDEALAELTRRAETKEVE